MIDYIRKNWLIILFIFIVCFIISNIIVKFTGFEIDYHIRLYEIMYFALTFFIGILIPFYIKKLIEDNRSIKSILIDDAKDLLNGLSSINTNIRKEQQVEPVSSTTKDNINYCFHLAELKLDSLDQQLSISFSNDRKKIIEPLKKVYFDYKNFLTGGEFMVSTFKNSDKFIRENNVNFSDFDLAVKKAIHKISKL